MHSLNKLAKQHITSLSNSKPIYKACKKATYFPAQVLFILHWDSFQMMYFSRSNMNVSLHRVPVCLRLRRLLRARDLCQTNLAACYSLDTGHLVTQATPGIPN